MQVSSFIVLTILANREKQRYGTGPVLRFQIRGYNWWIWYTYSQISFRKWEGSCSGCDLLVALSGPGDFRFIRMYGYKKQSSDMVGRCGKID
jgi:hypothetical protein